MSTRRESILKELNPEQLIRAYIKAKGENENLIPKHAIDKAIGEIEELLHFLNIEPYPESDNQ